MSGTRTIVRCCWRSISDFSRLTLLTQVPERKIIHIDMDAFYASVEQRDHPEYRGRPLVVGRADGRGVVAAASYEARQYGIRSAMPSVRAVRLCPDLIFVPGRMEVYRSVSAQIHRIFHEYTDLVEPLALDEAFLDVTENKAGLALAVDVARAIRRRTATSWGLSLRPACRTTRFLAKVASDYRKPDGLCTIHPTARRPLSRVCRSRRFGEWGE